MKPPTFREYCQTQINALDFSKIHIECVKCNKIMNVCMEFIAIFHNPDNLTNYIAFCGNCYSNKELIRKVVGEWLKSPK